MMKRIPEYCHFLIAAAFIATAAVAGCGTAGINRVGDAADFSHQETAFMTGTGKNLSAGTVSFWHGSDGENLAFAPVEGGDVVAVYDAEKGGEIRRLGSAGTDKGQLDGPVDTVVADNLLFVLERGNRRIQVFHLPEMESFGFFGDDRLNDPSHIALYRIEHGAFYIYVADIVESGGGQTAGILRFSASRAVNTFHTAYQKTFGYTENGGYLGTVRSIEIDPEQKRLLVDDGNVRRYSIDGDAVGR